MDGSGTKLSGWPCTSRCQIICIYPKQSLTSCSTDRPAICSAFWQDHGKLNNVERIFRLKLVAHFKI